MILRYVVVKTYAPDYETADFTDIKTFNDPVSALEFSNEKEAYDEDYTFYTVEVREPLEIITFNK